MANRVIQLLRSNTLYADKTAAKAALTALANRKDGELVLARYLSGTSVKSLIGVYHANPDLTTNNTGVTPANLPGWTFIEDPSAIEEVLSGLDVNVNYTDGTGGAADSATSSDLVVLAVKQVDGQVSAVTGNLSDVTLGGYSKTADTGAIAATDSLEVALSKLENTAAATTVTNSDRSIAVDTSGPTTDVSVRIKSGEHVLANDNTANAGGLYTDVRIAKVVLSGAGSGDQGAAAHDEVVGTLSSNVREAFQLIATDGTQLGQQINIYKDSALTDVFIGHVDDVFTTPIDAQHPTEANAYVDKTTSVTDGSGSEALVFIYNRADGTYELVAVDLETFLQENEFGNGLQVVDHVVSVKKDATSESFLSVSSDGVKISGVQDAIDSAISDLSDLIDAAVGTTDVVYTAPTGTNYLDSSTSVTDALSKLDTAAGNGLDSISSGNDAIAVGTKSNKDQSVSLVLADSTTADANRNATDDNVLSIVTGDGLYLSGLWDCGTY